MLVAKDFNFAQRHKEMREQRGLTQQQESEEVGVSANVISNWEMGIALPRTATIPLICLALNCSADYLFGLSERVITGDELRLLQNYRNLDPDGQFAIRATMDIQLQLHALPTSEE